MGEWRYSPNILNLVTNGDEWLASRPGCFTPGTHWIGGWVGPRANLDAVEERKMLLHQKQTQFLPHSKYASSL
jgi:hypothetical protein